LDVVITKIILLVFLLRHGVYANARPERITYGEDMLSLTQCSGHIDRTVRCRRTVRRFTGHYWT